MQCRVCGDVLFGIEDDLCSRCNCQDHYKDISWYKDCDLKPGCSLLDKNGICNEECLEERINKELGD